MGARGTPGFTGADLQNLMNEAAILTARRELNEMSMDEITDALEKIVAGAEKKISIVPRGAAGGLTFFAPSEERLESGLYSKSYLKNQMAVALGGRIAEELIFGEDMVTTGASGDFQQVTRTARLMVTQLGFSDKIGQLCIGGSSGPSFLGQEMGQGQDMSMETMDVIDSEVRALVRQAYRRAKDLIVSNMAVLHKTADVLLEKENIN